MIKASTSLVGWIAAAALGASCAASQGSGSNPTSPMDPGADAGGQMDAGMDAGADTGADAGDQSDAGGGSITGVQPNPWNFGILDPTLLYYASVADMPVPPYTLTLRMSQLVFVISADAVRPFLPPAFVPVSAAGQTELIVAGTHYLNISVPEPDGGVGAFTYDEVAFMVPVTLAGDLGTIYDAFLKLHLNQPEPIDLGRQVYGFPKYLDDSIQTVTDPSVSQVSYQGTENGAPTFDIQAVRGLPLDLSTVVLPAGLPGLSTILASPGLFIDVHGAVTVCPMTDQLGPPIALIPTSVALPELQEAGILFAAQPPVAAIHYDQVTMNLGWPLTPTGQVIPFPAQ